MSYRASSKLAAALLCAAGVVLPSIANAAEKRTWVVSWFTQALHSVEGDCPKGYNALIAEAYRRDLEAVGTAPAEVEKIMEGMNRNDPYSVQALVNRGRIDGKPVNAYTHPDAVPTPPQLVSEGKYAYGFNLDGKGAASPLGFEDPETGEKGVNNQYARVTGCLIGSRAAPPIRPLYWELTWRTMRDAIPAWVITATVDNEQTGDATITIDKSLDHPKLDANGDSKLDVTYRIDPDPRWHNVFKAKLKGDTFYIDQGKLALKGDPYMIAVLQLHTVKMRLKMKEDGSLDGILGGYEPWEDINFMYASRGYLSESMVGVDMVTMYKSLREHADADPDPVTGRNKSISVGYRIEGVRAFAVPADGQVARAP